MEKMRCPHGKYFSNKGRAGEQLYESSEKTSGLRRGGIFLHFFAHFILPGLQLCDYLTRQ